MLILTTRLSPPYSQIVILDPGSKVDVPEWTKDLGVISTDTCILVACLTDIDGETEFTLGHAKEVDPGTRPTFERKLKTPTHQIALETVEGDPVLRMQTAGPEITIRIWANALREPDKIVVGIE